MVGGTSISFSKDGRFSSSFIVASEGGSVYKCLLRSHTGAGSLADAPLPEAEMPWLREAKAAIMRVRAGDRYCC